MNMDRFLKPYVLRKVASSVGMRRVYWLNVLFGINRREYGVRWS